MLGVEVVSLVGDTLHGFVHIGRGQGVAVGHGAQFLGVEPLALVAPRGDGFVAFDGTAIEFETRLVVTSGIQTFVISGAEAPRCDPALAPTSGVDRRFLAYLGGVAIALLGLLAFVASLPEDPSGMHAMGHDWSPPGYVVRDVHRPKADANAEPVVNCGRGSCCGLLLDPQSSVLGKPVPPPREPAGGRGEIYGNLPGTEIGEVAGAAGISLRGAAPRPVGWGIMGSGVYGFIGEGSGTGPGYCGGDMIAREDLLAGGCTIGSARGRPRVIPKVEMGKPTTAGDLDENIIRRYMRRKLGAITQCYARQMRRSLVAPELAGTVVASFHISPIGRVQGARASGLGDEVDQCVAGVISGLEFPSPRNGGYVAVTYPFTFRDAAR